MLRPKTFQLSSLCFGLFLLFIFFCYACSFNPAVQSRGEGYLQGEWQQDSLYTGKQLVSYSLSNIKFSCDSFYITVNTVSNINYGADSCMKHGRWTEYIRGKYSQKKDTLHLKGFFYNANGTFKTVNDCFRAGVYEDFFKVQVLSDSLIQLSVNPATIPMNMRLVNQAVCVPKPL
ncbi:fumarate hydratase [Mucilaginibacter hurinus]|uniref:Fumarate hydratase n=1 Tax=Mucilaginibacter hurinus TaxID=2201324 RepID=A0A367GSJ5_9SPHI|nr:fumarate hydratase [Mucilaginibacter hurinus]RCH55731.1 fumarate hydratase [Mucilaginibacter hurinus]